MPNAFVRKKYAVYIIATISLFEYLNGSFSKLLFSIFYLCFWPLHSL